MRKPAFKVVRPEKTQNKPAQLHKLARKWDIATINIILSRQGKRSAWYKLKNLFLRKLGKPLDAELSVTLGKHFEPQHDKTNNVAVHPQISLGICPVWSESSLSAWRNLGFLATQWAHSKDSWSDWAEAQADLSLRWAHTYFVGFVMSRLILWPLPCSC